MWWESLVAELMGRKMSEEAIVDSLPVISEQERKAKLMHFIYEATGVSKLKLLRERDLINFQNSRDKIVQSIQSLYDKREPKDYPITKSIFSRRFGQFLHLFVIKCGESLFAPDNGSADLVDFFQIMLLTEYMPFRHTATLACLKIITAGAHVGSQIMKNIELIESENGEGSLRHLAYTLNNLRTSLEDVKYTLKELCKSVSKRYADVSDVIRVLCLKEAELWCRGLLPVVGLKVFSVSLACRLVDAKGPVRLQALLVVLTLIRNQDNLPIAINNKVSKLFHVIHKQLFYNTLDKIQNNATIAVEVFAEAFEYRTFYDVFPADVVHGLLLHIYSENVEIGSQAGAILKNAIEMQTENAIERLREVLKFSAQRVGGETCVFFGLEFASCEWFLNSVQLMRALLQNSDEPLSVNERRSLVALLGCLVWTLATDLTVKRQRVPETEVLKNLFPLPLADQRLKPLPPVVLEEFPYILILCAREDLESCIYLVRLLQFMTYDDSSAEQELLITWLVKAFDESEDIDFLKEVSRALATLVKQSTKESIQSHIQDIAQSSINEAREIFMMVYSQRLSDEHELERLRNSMMKMLALLTHGHLDDYESVDEFTSDVHDLMKALFQSESAITPIRVQLMETSFEIVYCHLILQSKCEDTWESSVLDPEVTYLQKTINSLLRWGSSIILKKEAAVRLRIYPILCDVLVDLMPGRHFSDVTLQRFVMASKRVLEMDVFQMDEEGEFRQELLEPRLKILHKFCRVVNSKIIPISELPPVFHHYSKCCDSYDEVLRRMILAKRSSGNEQEILIAILRSLQEAYLQDGLKSSQEVARKLAVLFERPKELGTSLVFHETLLMICSSLNPSGWNDDTTTFAHYTAMSFTELVKNLSLEQLGNSIYTKITYFQSVLRNTDVDEYVENYLLLIKRTRERLAEYVRRSNVNTSRRVPERRGQSNLVANRRGQRRVIRDDDSGSDSQKHSPTRRSNVGSRNRSRSGNRASADDDSGSDSQERSRRPNLASRNRTRSGNRSSPDGT